MNTFYQASSARQSALMVFVFLALILCLCNFFALPYRKRANRLRFLNAGLFAVLFALDALMGHAFWGMRNGTPYREVLRLPLWSLWCAAAVSFLLLAAESVLLIHSGKQELHRNAVKQAMDTLPSAICYFTPEGTVKLCNLQMHRLFRSLAQSDLQTLEELHRALEGCDERSGVILLSKELQTYLFPSGKVWRYFETTVTASDGIPYAEAIFTDVTELYQDSRKLAELTRRLEQTSQDLKLLSYHAQTAAKEQEILSAKTTLHDQMGAGVLAVRRILQSGKTAQAAYAVELFQRAVRMIKNDNESSLGRNALAEFLHDADTIGVQVLLTGSLPKQEDLAHAFVLTMRECLTNGIRHADASELRISITQSESVAVLHITNNGAVPKSPVRAKGGLKNLERYITNLRGTMEIQSTPAFALTVTIPLAEPSQRRAQE